MAEASMSEQEYVSEPYQKVSGICEAVTLPQKTLNFLDTNGGVVRDACSNLPNNNVCGLGTLNCLAEMDCSGSTPKNSSTPETSAGDNSSLEEFGQEDYSSSQSHHLADSSTTLRPPEEDPRQLYGGVDINSPLEDYEGVSNGSFRKNNKIRKTSSRKKLGLQASRGRPRKALVAMYHSQISGDKNTIKIRIRKSNLSPEVQLPPNKKKSGRRKKHKITSDTDTSDYETNKKKGRISQEVSAECSSIPEPLEQSKWAESMPQLVLERIFQNVCVQEGCVPVLFRLCRVCKLWRDVALAPSLWRNVDLNYIPEKFRTDLNLHWLIQNRLQCCQDLNLGEWKVRDIQSALDALCSNCPQLRGLNLSGWKGLNADHLKYLTVECEKLERLDLSSINNTSAINAQPLVGLAQTMSSRLTHLVLAHNKLAGFTQIIAAIAANCPNLQLLDISNIRTFAHNTALLHVEKLQGGCQKLRVLRLTNSQIWLAPTSLSDQVASPGFPNLEELSLAGIEDDQITARSIDDDGIERILKNSNKLRLLDVRGCIRLTDSGLVKVPAWDLEHLFLSACYVTRMQNSGLELILQKWSHSLMEVDLAWSTATSSLDAAVFALAEKGDESPLRTLNLCGSSVSLDPVKAVLRKCPRLNYINLQSCRALPRGIKRLYTGASVCELRQSFEERPKTDDAEPDGVRVSERND